jgi:glutaminyl-tRNA synthetase
MSLRAKIDMTSPNMNMRDPVMYRILNVLTTEQEIGKFIRCTTGHMEKVIIWSRFHTRFCSLEFENHDLYNWYLDQVYEKEK